MAEAAADAVLRDFETLILLTLVVGLVAFFAWYRIRGRARYGGMVDASPFTYADLFIAPLVLIKYSVTLQMLAVFLFGLPVRLIEKLVGYPVAEVKATELASAVEITPELLLFDLLLNIMLVSLVIIMIQWVGQRDPLRIFGLRGVNWKRALLWISAGALVATPLAIYLSLVMHRVLTPMFGEDLQDQAAVKSIREAGDLLIRILLIANACLVAPVVEEIVFRGYLYGVLKRFTGPMFGAFISSALFAAAHQNLVALLPLWGLALFLTTFYEATRSLWVPIGIHAVFNAVNVTLLLLQPQEGRADSETALGWFFG